jgi:NADH:ubiquinone oxidoreductase subunit 5 (subunit L)/multisubunit Na+/H+ antiporter MnhA subunit
MAYIVVFAPLLAAIIAGLLQKQIGDRLAQILTTGATIAAALGSVVLFFDVAVAATPAPSSWRNGWRSAISRSTGRSAWTRCRRSCWS